MLFKKDSQMQKPMTNNKQLKIKQLLLTIFPFLVITTSMLSCQRPQLEKTSVLQLQLPKYYTNSAAQAHTKSDVQAYASTLKHVLLNVSAGDIPTLSATWSKDDNSPICNSSNCTLEVKSGDNRLIQFLGVYESAAGVTEFAYGDLTTALSPGAQSINITMSDLTIAGSAIETDIMGRYLSTSGVGPTGKIDVYFTPTGKPRMYFGQTYMYNGWFSLFGMTGVKFEYFVNGLSIFGGPTSIDQQFATSNSQVRIYFPGHYEQNSNSVVRYRQPQIYFFGFFGPGLSGSEILCANSAASDTPVSYRWTDLAISNLIQYNSSDPNNTTVVRPDRSTNPGGCTGLTSNLVSPTGLYIDPTGSRSLRPVPPFFTTNSSGDDIYVNGSLAQIRILPGISTSTVAGVKLFNIPGSLFNNYRFSGPFERYDCAAVAAAVGTNGISLYGDGPNTSTGPSYSYTIAMPGVLTNGTYLLACAYDANNNFHQSAVYTQF